MGVDACTALLRRSAAVNSGRGRLKHGSGLGVQGVGCGILFWGDEGLGSSSPVWSIPARSEGR